MSEFSHKKDILHELVKARNAVKRKYNLLKYGKDTFEEAMEHTFKPIVDPPQKLVETSKNHIQSEKDVTNQEINDTLDISYIPDSSLDNTYGNDTLNNTIRNIKIDSTFETAGSEIEEEEEKGSNLLDSKYKRMLS